ncbi:MAG: cysteine hydrolase [Candidatus Diapherotrites archaeon]|nr:cysteine hydrolase [Candidatus Diapherotrites archaeon]
MDSALIVIDMQNDFALKGGALYVPEGEQVIPVILKLVKTASAKKAPVVFTMDWHSENDPEFSAENWPKHCVVGSKGAEFVEALKSFAEKSEIVKQPGHDKFPGTNLEAFLRKHNAKKLFFCGLATEYCVKFTALAALALGFEVFVVRDAIRPVDYRDGLAVLRELEEKGIRAVPAEDAGRMLRL